MGRRANKMSTDRATKKGTNTKSKEKGEGGRRSADCVDPSEGCSGASYLLPSKNSAPDTKVSNERQRDIRRSLMAKATKSQRGPGGPISSADCAGPSEGSIGAQYTTPCSSRAVDRKVFDGQRRTARSIQKKKKPATEHGEIQEVDRSVCGGGKNSRCVYGADAGMESSGPSNNRIEENRTNVTKRLRLVRKTSPAKSEKGGAARLQYPGFLWFYKREKV